MNDEVKKKVAAMSDDDFIDVITICTVASDRIHALAESRTEPREIRMGKIIGIVSEALGVVEEKYGNLLLVEHPDVPLEKSYLLSCARSSMHSIKWFGNMADECIKLDERGGKGDFSEIVISRRTRFEVVHGKVEDDLSKWKFEPSDSGDGWVAYNIDFEPLSVLDVIVMIPYKSDWSHFGNIIVIDPGDGMEFSEILCKYDETGIYPIDVTDEGEVIRSDDMTTINSWGGTGVKSVECVESSSGLNVWNIEVIGNDDDDED